MNQEPGTEAEIKAFVQDRYNARFPLFSKIEVNGANTHPVYSYCRNNSSLYDSGKNQAEVIPWNFAKFLVDTNGKVQHYFEPRSNPLSFTDKIESML